MIGSKTAKFSQPDAKNEIPNARFYLVPFSKAKREMGDLNYNYNTESSEIWFRNKSQDNYVSMGVRSYDVSMNEVVYKNKYKEDEYKNKYMKTIISNPEVFRKKSGEFTNYLNSSISVTKKNPFSRPKNDSKK